jgi:hypothetical protein
MFPQASRKLLYVELDEKEALAKVGHTFPDMADLQQSSRTIKPSLQKEYIQPPKMQTNFFDDDSSFEVSALRWLVQYLHCGERTIMMIILSHCQYPHLPHSTLHQRLEYYYVQEYFSISTWQQTKTIFWLGMGSADWPGEGTRDGRESW